MKDNWQKLKDKLNEQVLDCKKHTGCSGNWSVCLRMYREVFKVITAIENGEEDKLIAFNGTFKTKEEIDEIMSGD